MSNRNKRKGTAFESLVANALNRFWRNRYGLKAYRPAQRGRRDVGDINGVSPFVIQAKDYSSWEEAIRLGLNGAEEQKTNAGEPFGVAVVKRSRRPIGEAYTVMTLETFARLLVRLRRAEDYLGSTGWLQPHAEETAEDLRTPFPRAADLRGEQ